RQLHRDSRQLVELRWRPCRHLVAMLVIPANHLVAVAAVDGEDHQRREIWDQNRPVEGLQLIETREGVGKTIEDAGCKQQRGRACHKHAFKKLPVPSLTVWESPRD